MLKQFMLLSFFILIAFNAALAQNHTDKILVQKTMEAYIDAFYEGDSSKIIDHFSTDIVKYGYYQAKDSANYAGEPMSFQQMKDYATSVKKRNHKLPETTIKKVEVFDVQDQTASGKVTAWWGTDYILLGKESGKWMIRMILWQGPLLQ